MAVPTTITDLSTTANSNSPAGSEVPSSGNGPDEYIRALGSIVRVLRAKGSDVASATTTDLGAATTGDFVHVTGTTTITGLGTVAAGIKKVVTFDGALTLTHNGTSLILPGAANITTAAGDCAEFVSEGSGNWRCTSYVYASGVVSKTSTQTMAGASFNVAAEVDVASAGTTNIGGAASNQIRITGTTTITSFGTTYTGPRYIRFADALTLTHNGTSLILPGAANITTAAGDTCIALPLPSSAGWYVSTYIKANGTAVVSSSTIDNSVNDFRLTLTSGTPVTVTDVTGATNVYLTPYTGNRIALYDGSSTWSIYTSAEVTQALGTITSGLPYDIFVYSNSGTVATEILAWTNTTTRATALTRQDGVLVKSGQTTRRYVGTFYTTSTTQTEDSKTNRYLFNYYNRVTRNTQTQFATDRTVASASYAEANSEIRAGLIVGVSEDAVYASLTGGVDQSSDNTSAQAAIAFDSTSAADTGLVAQVNGVGWFQLSVSGYRNAPLSAGVHYATVLGRSASTSITFRGTEDATATKATLHTALPM